MVYGDHRRRSNNNSNSNSNRNSNVETPDMFQNAGQLQPSSWMDDGKNLPDFTNEQQHRLVQEANSMENVNVNEIDNDNDNNNNYYYQAQNSISMSPRPISAMTDSSEVTNDSRQENRFVGNVNDFM